MPTVSVTHAARSRSSMSASPLVVALIAALLALGGCSSGGGSGDPEPDPVDKPDPGPNPVPPPGDIPVRDLLPEPRGLLPSLDTGDLEFESLHHSGSGVCEACHSNGDPGTGNMVVFEDEGTRDVSIGTAWESSMMANSTRDPYWHAVYASELANYPNLDGKINDTCTRCHAPMANDYAKKEGLPIQLFDSGSEANGDFIAGLYGREAGDPLFDHAIDGVSCSLCHQIADDGNLGTTPSFTGGFHIEQFPESEIAERPAYGQYADVDIGYMKQQSKFTPQFGAHTSTSEMCATCHNLTTNSVDRDGNEDPGPNPFPEQAMYTEWEESAYAVGGAQEASCQSCHMPVVDQPVALERDGEVRRDDFAEHSFLGANTVMQTMLRDFRGELGVPADVDFDTSIDRNRAFLATAAELEIEPVAAGEGTVGFDVTVKNLTGHKLPSGYHSRRVYLHVQVTDRDGAVVYQSGALDGDGRIAGNIGDTLPTRYEPHYDTITTPNEVQIYQAIMENSDGERTHSLLNGYRYVKDNRLTPAGFDKQSVPDEVAVHGEALADDDFDAGLDTVSYRLPIDSNGPHQVRVELRYQPLDYGHLAVLFLRSDTLDAVDSFRTMYDSLERHDELIDFVTVSIP